MDLGSMYYAFNRAMKRPNHSYLTFFDKVLVPKNVKRDIETESGARILANIIVISFFIGVLGLLVLQSKSPMSFINLGTLVVLSVVSIILIRKNAIQGAGYVQLVAMAIPSLLSPFGFLNYHYLEAYYVVAFAMVLLLAVTSYAPKKANLWLVVILASMSLFGVYFVREVPKAGTLLSTDMDVFLISFALLLTAGFLTSLFINVRRANFLQVREQAQESKSKAATLGTMVTGMAHEINTPLGVAITGASMLSSSKEQLSPDQGSAIELVNRNLNRVALLVNRFKEIEMVATDEVYGPFRPETAIEDITIEFAELFKKHGVTLKTERLDMDDHDDGLFIGYFQSFKQILVQLIRNSLDHGFDSTAQDREITIQVARLPGQLKLLYGDNGRQIDREIRPRMFDPFVTSNRGNGHIGLGLFLVYRLVHEKMHGTIEYYETPSGSKFELVLPSGGESFKNQ